MTKRVAKRTVLISAVVLTLGFLILLLGLGVRGSIMGEPARAASETEQQAAALAKAQALVVDKLKGSQATLKREFPPGGEGSEPEYSFTSSDGGKVEIRVGAVSGEILGAVFEDPGGTLFPPLERPLSFDEATAVAREFASTVYTSWTDRNWVFVSPVQQADASKDKAASYILRWEERLAGGVATPNFVEATVRARSGRIVYYSAKNVPITVSPTPGVKKEAAVDAAARVLDLPPSAAKSAVLKVIIDTQMQQRLVWEVDLLVEPRDRVDYGGIEWVDALTGKVVDDLLPMASQPVK